MLQSGRAVETTFSMATRLAGNRGVFSRWITLSHPRLRANTAMCVPRFTWTRWVPSTLTLPLLSKFSTNEESSLQKVYFTARSYRKGRRPSNLLEADYSLEAEYRLEDDYMLEAD